MRERSLADRSKVTSVQVAIVGAVVAVWWWVAAEELVSPLLLPEPRAVIQALPSLLTDPRTWGHLKITGIEILGAFLFSAIAGMFVGFWLGLSGYRTRLLEPFLVSGYMVPIVLLYPVVLLLFGVGPESKVVFAGIYGFFPVVLNTMRGLRSVDRGLVTAAVSLGASTWQRIVHVMIPGAKPMIVAGLRVGAALDLTGVLVGEMLASRAGLGYEIARTAQTFATAKLYGYIAIALVLIALFNRVVARHS